MRRGGIFYSRLGFLLALRPHVNDSNNSQAHECSFEIDRTKIFHKNYGVKTVMLKIQIAFQGACLCQIIKRSLVCYSEHIILH